MSVSFLPNSLGIVRVSDVPTSAFTSFTNGGFVDVMSLARISTFCRRAAISSWSEVSTFLNGGLRTESGDPMRTFMVAHDVTVHWPGMSPWTFTSRCHADVQPSAVGTSSFSVFATIFDSSTGFVIGTTLVTYAAVNFVTRKPVPLPGTLRTSMEAMIGQVPSDAMKLLPAKRDRVNVTTEEATSVASAVAGTTTAAGSRGEGSSGLPVIATVALRRSDYDQNNHVNQSVYGQAAVDAACTWCERQGVVPAHSAESGGEADLHASSHVMATSIRLDYKAEVRTLGTLGVGLFAEASESSSSPGGPREVQRCRFIVADGTALNCAGRVAVERYVPRSGET